MKKICLALLCVITISFSGCDLFINKTQALVDTLTALDTVTIKESQLLREYNNYILDPQNFDSDAETAVELMNFYFNEFEDSISAIDKFLTEAEFTADQKKLILDKYPVYQETSKKYLKTIEDFKVEFNEYLLAEDPKDQKIRQEKLKEKFAKIQDESFIFFKEHTDFMSEVLNLEYGVNFIKLG